MVVVVVVVKGLEAIRRESLYGCNCICISPLSPLSLSSEAEEYDSGGGVAMDNFVGENEMKGREERERLGVPYYCRTVENWDWERGKVERF